MASPGRVVKTYTEAPSGYEVASEAPAPFRFEVTWRSLAPVAHPTDGAPTVIAPLQIELPAAALTPPHFASVSGPLSQRSWKALLCAALLGMVAIGVVASLGRRSAQPDESHGSTMNMGGAGWVSEWVSDPSGSARGRQLSLYRPSGSMSDFQFEFSGQIARQSLGWAFRVADTKNYYVGKLGIPAGGPLTFTRFAVIRGVEGSRHETPIRLAVFPLNVRLEAQGSRFTLYLQKQVVDDWEDTRLKTGSVGFLNERQEQGQVESVQISFLKPGARR